MDREAFWARVAARRERHDARPGWVRVLMVLAPIALILACCANCQVMGGGGSQAERAAVSSACAYLTVQDVAGVFSVQGAALVEEAPGDSGGVITYGCDVRSATDLRLRLDVANHGRKPATVVVAMAVSKQASYVADGGDAELSVAKQVGGRFYVLTLTGSQAGTPVSEAELAALASLVTSRF